MIAVLLLAPLAPLLPAAEKATPPRNFADLSIEELMAVPITSVSKKQTTLHRSPAAVAVVTSDDVNRLGITTLPEALRLVPGMAVARANANKWAITARGFNNEFANKLLVLVDGRSVYTPAFAGVHWDVQDILMENLDRIEVIRGPGATLWGANAVNGVINVSTKSAKETQGLLLSAVTGTHERYGFGARYGGKLAPEIFFRADAKYFDRSGFVDSTGAETPDRWDLFRTGFRVDGTPAPDSGFTVIGNYHTGHSGEFKQRATLTPPYSVAFDALGLNRGGNLLARWRRDFSTTSQLTVQAYHDRWDQDAGENLNSETRATSDVEVQHRFALHARHDIVSGFGYRYTSDRMPSNFGLTWTPDRQTSDLFNVFVQDEIALLPSRWHAILGVKAEHNDYTSWDLQPNVRLLWTPGPRHTAWAAVSHAVRTPSRFERTARLNVAAFRPSPFGPPFLVSLFGNPDVKPEKLTAHEVGYRFEPSRDFAVDLTGFYNEYDRLLIFVAGPSRMEATPSPAHLLVNPSTMQNAGHGHTYGAEASAQWRATDRWKLAASYSWLEMRLHPTSSVDGADSPAHQIHLRSYYDLPRNVQLNVSANYVSRLATIGVPAYVRLDLGLRWQPTPSLELGVWGQNLLDDRHPEFTSRISSLRPEVPRSIVGKITWSY